MSPFDEWVYDGGQRVAPRPVDVGCVPTRVDAWGDVEPHQGRTLSDKQRDAWERFGALDPGVLRADLAAGFAALAERVGSVSDPFGSVLGSRKRADELAALFDQAARRLAQEPTEPGQWPRIVRATSVLLPRQDQADHRLVVVSLDVGFPSEKAFEVEVLFANERMALIGEHCGLAARIEWADINVPGADPFALDHPYW